MKMDTLPQWSAAEEENNSLYTSIEPIIKIKSKHILFVFSYLVLSAFALMVTLLVKCHPIFGVLHFFSTLCVCIVLWAKLGKIAHAQNNPVANV